eukprot:Skav220144  [mRNA]  locus=scaffold1320:317401:317652:+ [translate_table: standard]
MAFSVFAAEERAILLLTKLERRALQPHPLPYSHAISACSKAVQWTSALHLMEEMKERQVPVEDIAYTAAIGACQKAQMSPGVF